MTRPTALRYASILLCSICLLASHAAAQYLYLDTDGDGVPTAADVLAPSGATSIDIWIDTDSNRDGSPAACPTQDGDLTINSYEVILRATNGTISWGTFTNRQPDFTTSFGEASSATELYRGFGGGAILPPGLYRLATIEASVAGGTPDLGVATSTTLGPVYLTSFGSRCSGNDFDNTMKLGLDWFDADGLPYGGVANQVPTLVQPADMEVGEGEVAQQGLTATDPDGQPLQFVKVSGPMFATVSTLDPGIGSASGQITLAPTFQDAGTTTLVVAASDGFAQDTRSLQVHVLDRSQLALTPIDDVAVAAGGYRALTAVAVDPDVSTVTFALTSAPPYVHLGPTAGVAATVYISPPAGATGVSTVTVSATSGTTTVSESFEVTVTPPSPCTAGWCASERTFSSLIFPDRVEPTDYNHDGILDLVVVYSANISAFPGLGNGVFGHRIDTPTPSSNVWIEVIVADYDGDGVEDVLGTRYKNNQYDLVLFRGHVDGRFESEQVVGNASFFYDQPVLEDVNGDEYADLFLPRPEGLTLSLGMGGGLYQPPVSLGPAGYGLLLADFNQDGKVDLAFSSGGIQVRLGTGTGSFGSAMVLNPGFVATELAAADLNRDGRMDLIAMSPNLVSPGKCFLGNGNGTFSAVPSGFWVPGYVSELNAGDVTGDGAPDLHVRFWKSGGGSGQSVIAGAGDGTLIDRTDYSSGHPYGFYDVAMADWDEDGVQDIAGVGSSDPKVTVFLGRDYAPHPNRQPTIVNTILVEVHEGIGTYFEASADDPDLDRPQLDVDTSALPPGGSLNVSRSDNYVGVSWTPPFGSVGEYPVRFRATAGGEIVEATTTVRVLRGSRPPVASAGGPYSGVVGVPVQFDASNSSDPDGDPLTYSWSYGDGSNGVGVQPQHVYASQGVYSVYVVVSDGLNSRFSFTTASISEALAANAFIAGSPTVALAGGGSSSTCVQIEADQGRFNPADIDPNTVVMKSVGTGAIPEIQAIAEKSSTVEDRDKDGVPDLSACFRRTDLRQLFSFVTGRDTVSVTIEGRLPTGATIRANLEMVVVGGGGPLSAVVAPNPLNPRAILSFVTPRGGLVRVELFDVTGRRVRTLLHESRLPAGYHEVPIDGTGENGTRLASGVYFYRIAAPGSVATGRLSVLK